MTGFDWVGAGLRGFGFGTGLDNMHNLVLYKDKMINAFLAQEITLSVRSSMIFFNSSLNLHISCSDLQVVLIASSLLAFLQSALSQTFLSLLTQLPPS